MPYNEKLIKGRARVYVIGAIIVAVVALWRAFVEH